MKRILLCIVFSCLLAGAASAQLGIKPSSDEDLATEWLAPYIGKVDSVSGEQLKKLVELEIKIDKEVALKWLNNGAQPTDTVKAIFKNEGIMKEFADSKVKKGN